MKNSQGSSCCQYFTNMPRDGVENYLSRWVQIVRRELDSNRTATLRRTVSIIPLDGARTAIKEVKPFHLAVRISNDQVRPAASLHALGSSAVSNADIDCRRHVNFTERALRWRQSWEMRVVRISRPTTRVLSCISAKCLLTHKLRVEASLS